MNMDIIMKRLRNFDENSRDENNNISEEGKLNQFVKNIINDKKLDACRYDNYLRYAIEMNPDFHMYKRIKNSRELIPYDFIFHDVKPEPEKTVSSYFIDSTIKNWKRNEGVFILAGTGKGKNYFVRNLIISKNTKEKIVLFVNRATLFRQQKKIMEEKSLDLDDADIVTGDASKGLIKLKKNILLVSYQKAALKILNNDEEFLTYLSEVRYAVFDEVHYVLDDSYFNKGVNIIKENLLMRNIFEEPVLKNATKIFMSATMEEMLVLFRKMGYFSDYINYLHDPDYASNLVSFVNHKIKKKERIKRHEQFLCSPTDYDYINPIIYTKLELLVEEIEKNKEKWLIFVDSKEDGKKLCKLINDKCDKKTAVFISADNKDNKTFKEIAEKETFDCRVLIATTVLYNGINIKDESLKNIVLPYTTVPIMKQMIGRKRIQKDETLNVYFSDLKFEDIEDKFKNNIKDYLSICEMKKMNACSIAAYLNGMTEIKEQFFYAEQQYEEVKFGINEMAFYKLHFDTAFLLYLLKKISKEHSTYVREMLIHLGIEEKYEKAFENALLPEKERKDRARRELEKILTDNIDGITEVSVDDCFPRIHEFSVRMNEIYVKLNGKNLDTHHINKKRWISQEKANEFIESLDLPYSIEYTDKDPKTGIKSLKISKTGKGEK